MIPALIIDNYLGHFSTKDEQISTSYTRASIH